MHQEYFRAFVSTAQSHPRRSRASTRRAAPSHTTERRRTQQDDYPRYTHPPRRARAIAREGIGDDAPCLHRSIHPRRPFRAPRAPRARAGGAEDREKRRARTVPLFHAFCLPFSIPLTFVCVFSMSRYTQRRFGRRSARVRRTRRRARGRTGRGIKREELFL